MRRVTSFSFGPRAAWAVIACFTLLLGTGPALAQSGDVRPQEAPRQGAAVQDPAKEFIEAEVAISGPAGQRECVWLGRRVVTLMWRDDLDTAFRHLDLYDRFGCPGGHVQAAFRCLTRFPALDPKAPADTLTGRAHACWVNPSLQPQPSATTATAPTTPPTPAPQGTAPATPPAPAAASK